MTGLTWEARYICYIDEHRLTITVQHDPIENDWTWSADWLKDNYYETESFPTADAAKDNATRWYFKHFLPARSASSPGR